MNRDYNAELEEFLKENKTLAYMMLKLAEKYSNSIALTYMDGDQWSSITWTDFGKKIRLTAKALLDLGIDVGDMIGIFSQNRPEWAISDLGIQATRAVTVPIYATNSDEEAEYIINDAEVKIIFVGDADQYKKAKEIMKRSSYLKKIIAYDNTITLEGDDSIYLDDLLESGEKSDKGSDLDTRLNSVESDDMLTLIYTSGTTGNPKGAIHTHRSFMAGIFAGWTRFQDATTKEVSLAILPLSHVFERMWSYGCMVSGTQIAYCPDPKRFVEIMTSIRPHLLTSVPRIWEKVYGTIHEGLKSAPPVKRKLFNWAKKVALTSYRKRKANKFRGPWIRFKYLIANALILTKVRKTLGCERNMVYHVGGAAFATEINEFFQSFGINIIQGFGLTEFFPVCVGFGDHGSDGACGPVIPLVDVRISDEGEIQLKGEMVMSGYYKKPDASKDVFTEDGWFKTQDIGYISGDEYKYITITDRIKDLIITAGGKNISPQQIELLFGDEMFVEQIIVVGEGKKFIGALVYPNFEVLEDYAKNNNIEYKSREALLENENIIKFYETIITDRTESLGQVEKIKKFRFLLKELTQEDGDLTPTLKKKRKVINEKYNDLINSIYE